MEKICLCKRKITTKKDSFSDRKSNIYYEGKAKILKELDCVDVLKKLRTVDVLTKLMLDSFSRRMLTF